jgi:hypothetical protein
MTATLLMSILTVTFVTAWAWRKLGQMAEAAEAKPTSIR